MSKEIWAVLEQSEAALREDSGELLAELTEIAQRQPEPTAVCAILLVAPGSSLPGTALLPRLGVRRLYLLEHVRLAHYTTEGYVSALAWLLQQRAPALVATTASANGRVWMPRLAARLHLPFVSGCLGLDLRDDALFALRSIYEGRAYVQTRAALHGRTALATLATGVRGVPTSMGAAASGDQSVEISTFAPEIEQQQEPIRRIAMQAPSPEEVELDVAEKIVAGGRGVGREGFAGLAAFARLLGAAVGATRVATDRGWVEHERQIGATGKSVHPKLYLACGISGAAQHTSGIREAETIVAINPDRNAPILALADLGLLGDANEILPLAAKMLEK